MENLFKTAVVIFCIAMSERYDGVVWFIAKALLIFYLVATYKETANEVVQKFKSSLPKPKEPASENLGAQIDQIKQSQAYQAKVNGAAIKEQQPQKPRNPFKFLRHYEEGKRRDEENATIQRQEEERRRRASSPNGPTASP